MENNKPTRKLFVEELKALGILGFPIAISGIAQFLPQQINLSFAGHIGQHELDVAGLAISVLVIGCLSVYYGLCYAIMGHYSQAFGRKDYREMTSYFQKTLVLAAYIFLATSILLINGEPFLVLIGQDRLIAAMARTYIWIFIPGAIGRLYFHILTRYLECQNLAWPGLVVSIITAALSYVLHLVFVTALDLGLNGAAIALTITFVLMPILMIIIMLILKSQRPSLLSWTTDWLKDWKPFFWAAIPSIVQVVCWWASSEIGTFLAGNLSVKELAAQTVLFQFQLFVSLVPSGFAGACCARAGHHLGSGDIRAAKISMISSLLLHCAFGVIISIVYVAFGRQLAQIFTNDKEVIDEVMNSILWLGASDVVECLVYSVLGSLRAMHRHSYTMVLTMISYYAIALPLMIVMMFHTSLRLKGFWIGLTIGASIQASSFIVYLIYVIRKGGYNSSYNGEKPELELADKDTESSPLIPADEAEMSIRSLSSVMPRGTMPVTRKESPSDFRQARSHVPLKELLLGKVLGTCIVLALFTSYILLAVFQDAYLEPYNTAWVNITGNATFNF